VINWVETDTGNLLQGNYDDLNLLGSIPGPPPAEVRDRFVALWTADLAVGQQTSKVRRADAALRESLDKAIEGLDHAMRRIAEKYEYESPED
jgi:hypothetical protein